MPEVNEVAPEQIRVRVDWSAVETGQPQHVNQALASLGPPGTDGMPDGVYVAVGTVLPLPLVDDDAEVRERLVEKLRSSGAKVNIAGSFHMTGTCWVSSSRSFSPPR
jgi:hypothetical protein